MGKHSIVRVLPVEEVVPPSDVRDELGIGAADKAHKLVRVRSNEEGEPFAYYVSWTLGIRSGFTKRRLEKTPRLDVLRENGIQLNKVEQVLAAESASGKVARELGVEPGTALLSIRRKTCNETGKVIDVLDCLYNPKRFQYAMELSLD